ncbi:Lpp/OprI family alanine-zipper lipoprotein [Pseudohalioglobus sediminis]|nr:Lpp/OprI family alanine-zipper lipoprotein [Pseudohalioglobus sediminis]
MNQSFKRAAMLTVVLSAAGLAGCASTGDIDELRADLAAANSAAEQAAADAASAKADAAAARAAAEAAQTSAAETNEKLDRMFKKSMYK